jgi:predicted dehydrogenase
MGDRLRCAVIGAGAAGGEFLCRLTHCPRAVAVAIAENQPQRAREICERFKLPRSYADYAELIDQPDIDAVMIALPTALQAKVAMDALKARKHVLLERPMALNLKDATRMVETARAAKRTLMVAQEGRFFRAAQLAKAVIQRGETGELYHARAWWMRRHHIPRLGSWHTQKGQAGGGCASDLGQGMLDLCLYLLGEFEVATVSARFHARFGPRGLGEQELGRAEAVGGRVFDVEDFATAFLRLKSGRSVVLESCWAGHLPPEQREQGLELLGANAGLSLPPARLFRPGPQGYDCTLLHAPKLPYAEDAVLHFAQCVLESRKPLVTPEESLAVQQILDALQTSAAEGREVALKMG